MPLVDRLDDGFSTKIDFGDFPSVEFFEKSLKPPGWSGGGGHDTTTMRNTVFNTMTSKKLKRLTPVRGTVSYTSAAFSASTVRVMINAKQLLTLTMPNLSTLAFYGFLDEFEPGDNTVDGQQPTASIVIIPTLEHPTTKVETAPVYTPPP